MKDPVGDHWNPLPLLVAHCGYVSSAVMQSWVQIGSTEAVWKCKYASGRSTCSVSNHAVCIRCQTILYYNEIDWNVIAPYYKSGWDQGCHGDSDGTPPVESGWWLGPGTAPPLSKVGFSSSHP
jgi:hypothetical protein